MRSTSESDKELFLDIESDYSQLSFVRNSIEKWLAGHGALHGIDDILLVAHEIMANAVEHGTGEGNGRIQVHLRWQGAEACIRVFDEGGLDADGLAPVPADANAEAGRGLVLVDGLARAWGFTRHRSGRPYVWAALPCPAP
ncbi:ATP-binding protein [Streptomyces sp. NPDC017943]|uniref:ATP-binding protein n=1 Tax=Streptomyces TaxID=1883 RepID=UPI00345310B7